MLENSGLCEFAIMVGESALKLALLIYFHPILKSICCISGYFFALCDGGGGPYAGSSEKERAQLWPALCHWQ